jgi:protein-L-isoaspartate(D-aspartate) O-methyltransferase
LIGQLAADGRLLVPVGDLDSQLLTLVRKTADGGVTVEKSTPCRFVKLIGSEGWNPND